MLKTIFICFGSIVLLIFFIWLFLKWYFSASQPAFDEEQDYRITGPANDNNLN